MATLSPEKTTREWQSGVYLPWLGYYNESWALRKDYVRTLLGVKGHRTSIMSPFPEELSQIHNVGIERLWNFVHEIDYDTISSSYVEENTCLYITLKMGAISYHFNIYDDEWSNKDPEIVLNINHPTLRYRSVMDHLSEIKYRINYNQLDVY